MPTEEVTLDHALGRFTASAIVSPLSLPPFDNSAMDGYAVRSADLVGASPQQPRTLRVIGRTAAGEQFPGTVGSGECVRLFTGSPMPAGADAVVMQEDTQRASESSPTVDVLDVVKPWENIRFAGEDVRANAPLLDAGTRLTPQRIGLLAAVGLPQVQVTRRPVAALIASGNELIEPGQALTPGGIFESNRITLGLALQQAGATVARQPLLKDSLEATTQAFRAAFEKSDLVVTSGGVSVGELDFLKPAFAALGGTTEFWKVSIKPGKPFVFGQWGEKFWFGLPGNPVSAWVTFLLLVRPAVLRFQGARETGLPVRWGKLGETMVNRGDRRHFVRVRCDPDGTIWSAGAQASHFLGSMSAADGLLDLAPGTTAQAGDWAPVLSVS